MNPAWIIVAIIAAACVLLIANHDAGTVFGMESNRFASLVWFVVLGAVIGAGLIARPGRLRDLARNFAIWLILISLLMVGYVYRYESQDIGARLTAGLIPGSPVSLSADGGDNATMLIRSGDGQYHARALANGATVRFIVDTGANLVVLTREDAEAAGIRADRLSYSVPVSTANGRTTAARVRLDEIAIGGIVRRDVPALVARAGALETSLLGMSFLSSLSAFEFRGDRLVLKD